MRERLIYLVFGYDQYEMPCEPVKAFESKGDADAFLERCRTHHEERPEWPKEEDDIIEWETTIRQPWVDSHPAGENGQNRDGFDVMEIPMESHP